MPSPPRIDNRKDLLLLLLYSPGRTGSYNEPIVGRTRLVKMLFLFREELLERFRKGTELSPDSYYEFYPWHYGPFSRDVYDDLTFFTLRGFIEPSESPEVSLPESKDELERWTSPLGAWQDDEAVGGYCEEEFKLAPEGEQYVKDLFELLSPEQRELLRDFKRRTSSAPLRALLRYVYSNYPKMTTRSRIKDDNADVC